MTGPRYRAGIVGCGRIACSFDDDPRRGYVSTHAGAYTRSPEVELVALADVDAARVEQYAAKYGVPGRYRECGEMLARERLDILSICTWNETHREITEQAVRAGVKAIFCEKPIAESLASADDMVRRCAQAGTLLVVDHQRRFDRFHREVAEFVGSGKLGAIQQVTCYYTAGLANTGTHLLDLLRLFLGEAEWVEGVESRAASPNPRDPNVDGWIQFHSGARAALQACDVREYTIFEVSLLGTRGRVRILNHGFDVQFESAGESRRFAGYRELHPAAAPMDGSGPREYMLQAVAHIVECLRAGRKPVSSGEDGRAALELICALRQSAAAGGERVHLPLAGSPMVISSR